VLANSTSFSSSRRHIANSPCPEIRGQDQARHAPRVAVGAAEALPDVLAGLPVGLVEGRRRDDAPPTTPPGILVAGLLSQLFRVGFVGKELSVSSFAYQGMRSHCPTTYSRSYPVASRTRRMKGQGDRKKDGMRPCRTLMGVLYLPEALHSALSRGLIAVAH
jgi:hypothetical protein